MSAIQQHSGTHAGTLCSRCSGLNILRILNQTPTVPKHNLVCSLGELSDNARCPLCQFFLQARVQPFSPASSSEKRTSLRYRLCAFPIGAVFGAGRLLNSTDQRTDTPRVGLKVLTDKGYHHASNALRWAKMPEAEGLIMQITEDSAAFSGRHVGPKIDLEAVRNWLAYCNHTHQPRCTIEDQERQERLPEGFTVIDCYTRTLVLWNDNSTIDTSKQGFVTLSYVWGGSTMIHRSKIAGEKLENDLPLTIEDSIRLTCEFGFQYLWIDRYCIDQNDSVAKQTQTQAMDAVYACSALTIIAAGGDNPSYGLPGVSSRARTSQPQVIIDNDLRLVFCPHNVRNEVTSSKWYTRGWTYQEGLLSRRRLVLTDTQAYFQCNGMHCLESVRAPLDRLHVAEKSNHLARRMSDAVDMSRVFPLRGLGRNSQDIGQRIDEYIRRELTSEDDVLNAIQGVFNAYKTLYTTGSGSSARPFRKLMGVPILPLPPPPAPFVPTLRNAKTWPVQPQPDLEAEAAMSRACDLQELVAGLCWQGQFRHPLGQPTDMASLPATRRRKFPSWSWAGWRLHGFQLSSLVEDIPLLYQRRQEQREHLWRFGRSGNAAKMLIDDDVQIQVKTFSNEKEVMKSWADFVSNDTQPTFSWMSRTGVRSVILHITAPCLDVLVDREDGAIRSSDKTLMASAVDWKTLVKQAAAAERLDESEPGSARSHTDATAIRFTLLLMAQVGTFQGADAFRNHILVLKRSREAGTMVRLAAVKVSGNFRWLSSFADSQKEEAIDGDDGGRVGNNDMETFTGWKKRRVKIE